MGLITLNTPNQQIEGDYRTPTLQLNPRCRTTRTPILSCSRLSAPGLDQDQEILRVSIIECTDTLTTFEVAIKSGHVLRSVLAESNRELTD
jgi:hypothetical protein